MSRGKSTFFLNRKQATDLFLVAISTLVAFSYAILAFKLHNSGLMLWSLLWIGGLQDTFLLDDRPGRKSMPFCIFLTLFVAYLLVPVFKTQKTTILISFPATVVCLFAYAFMVNSGFATQLLFRLRPIERNNVICVSSKLLLLILRHSAIQMLYAVLFLFIDQFTTAAFFTAISIICFIYVCKYWNYGAMLENNTLTTLWLKRKTYSLDSLSVSSRTSFAGKRITFKDSTGYDVFSMRIWFKGAIYAECILIKKRILK